MTSFGVQKGAIDLSNDSDLTRGKMMMSDTREAMHKIAINNNADWSIQDDQLVVIPKDKTLANNDLGYFSNYRYGR